MSDNRAMPHDAIWPSLRIEEWHRTCRTIHRWTQVVGKVKLALAPPVNHWWHVVLYVSPCGLTTSMVPYGMRAFSVEFDFIRHALVVTTSEGYEREMPLASQTVASFYRGFVAMLEDVDVVVPISTTPTEVADRVPFEEDVEGCEYDTAYATRFHGALLQSARVMTDFRGRFVGKVSPVHFFWGGFDLAVTRFSGRIAPEHGPVPNIPLHVVREAYSHEVSSAGFWPGGMFDGNPVEAMYYSYAYPEPPGFAEQSVLPAAARYEKTLGEFVLPYEAVRSAADPDRMLLDFFQSTYEAAANRGGWDRAALER